MSQPLTFICAVLGTDTTFEVTLRSTDSIYALKKSIKAEKQRTFDSIEADTLKLFKVKMDISNTENYEEATKAVAQELLVCPMQELKYPHAKLLDIFPESDLNTLRIHVLVERPAGESINSRVCSAVAAT